MKTKISIIKCKTYNPAEVQAAVRAAFDLLGGIGIFVKKGEKVIVKPNLLSGRPPEDGVNTHIEVVRAVVKLIKELGAVPFIADTPGGSVTSEQVYKSSGISAVAGEEGVELLEVKRVKMVKGIPIASYFFECDKIISLPKMKTHMLMTLTGAVKNMYGAVAGLNKAHLHKKFPAPGEFFNVLTDVFEAVKPHLVLMDGIVAMDGDGPSAGRLRPAGILIAGADSVAVDSVFSRLAGIKPLDILTTKEAYRRGLGEADINNIEVLGEKIGENLMKGFKLPSSKFVMSMPVFIMNFMAKLIKFRVYIDPRLCRKCKICAETCPVSAIGIDEKKSEINSDKCIRCMCCHEVCPYKAIELKSNVVAKIFGL
jgi:uncharacterized protein (DUF362 family)/Pyruvate/2-oxoacid:ferredoxin oxidoreductase delta subunit